MWKRFFIAFAFFAGATAMAAVDVNKATEAELDGVNGIGPSTSKQILAERKKGEFKDWEDLKSRIKGIGNARATKLSEQGLTVSGQPYKITTMMPKAIEEKRAGKKSLEAATADIAAKK